MNVVCLDMEGVLVPEIWIAFAEASGIPELKRTTRDEPDYDKLMTFRLNILKEHGLGLKEIQETIAKIEPLPGAKQFLDELRATTQVIILSDTFEQFAKPLMEKLGWPTIFCNTLEVAEDGTITGYRMRCEKSKLTTVRALQSCGFETIAAGDSFNDLGMIQASKAGFLFKSTEAIKADYPELPAYEEFDDLLTAIKAALRGVAMNEIFRKLAFYPADILLPKKADMTKWAVVACDQFTSQPEYWQAVEETVGEEPSALRLILPEAQLNGPDVESKIEGINAAMADYLEQDVFYALPDSLLYIQRTQSDGKIRHGLIGMVDLEQYDFTPGSGALIRATEGTVLERIPPRVRVRKDAPIELPHVMLLIDDPAKTVIEPITAQAPSMEQVYDFPLQQGGGHLKGWKLTAEQTDAVATALSALGTVEEMERKYGMKDAAPLLFAVGDGNHSLATAKACYENLKKVTPEEEWINLPARYALVEVVNNHDDALQFEPIHRVVFGVDPKALLEDFKAFYPGAHEGEGEGHSILYNYEGVSGVITVPNPTVQLAVGTLQNFIDKYLETHSGEVDYIHGDEVTETLGAKPGNIGFKLPAMGKEQLFKTVMADGVLPRKTFSMGHAQDKRYYVEARKIK